MPYAAKFSDGSYLVRVVNGRAFSERRRRTPDLADATHWTKAGHVKNAIVHAAEDGTVRAGEEVRIVEVSVEEKKVHDIVVVEGRKNSFRTRSSR